jgi:hypothetical protein
MRVGLQVGREIPHNAIGSDHQGQTDKGDCVWSNTSRSEVIDEEACHSRKHIFVKERSIFSRVDIVRQSLSGLIRQPKEASRLLNSILGAVFRLSCLGRHCIAERIENEGEQKLKAGDHNNKQPTLDYGANRL